MLATIATIVTTLAPIVSLLLAYLKANSTATQQATGAQIEAGQVAAVSLAAETRIAQAEVQAPSDRLSLIDQWKAGQA